MSLYQIEHIGCPSDCPISGDPHHHVKLHHVEGDSVYSVHPGLGPELLARCGVCENLGMQMPKPVDPAKGERLSEKLNAEQEDLARELTQIMGWWIDTAKTDAEKTVPKAIQYGAVDFDIMGQFMVALVADKLHGADDAEKMRVGREMAIAFYMLGKMGRMVGAYATGVLPSDDTLFDTTIYSMMLRRVRETGHWVEG